MRFKAVTLGLLLAGTSLGSAALTLGKARGAAWIGQPLELQIPVQRDAAEPEGALCAEADVFHGEARQDSSRVRIQTEQGTGTDSYSVRISSAALIDEPVVTVYVRVGCGQKSARKYVLLADFLPEQAALPARAAPVAPVVPTVVPTPSASESSPAIVIAPPAQPTAEAKEVAAPSKPKNTQIAVAAAPPPRKVAAAPKATAPAPAAKAAPSPERAPAANIGSGKPRLRLDPVETLAERVANLEATTTQTALQEDLAKDAQKMQQLQSDLRSLLDQAVKNEASLAAMRERLEKAEAERVPLSLVYGLVALVALSLGALAFLMTQRNRALPWERASDNAKNDAAADAAPKP